MAAYEINLKRELALKIEQRKYMLIEFIWCFEIIKAR